MRHCRKQTAATSSGRIDDHCITVIKEVLVCSPAGEQNGRIDLRVIQGFSAERGRIRLRSLPERRAELPMNSICFSKDWPLCKRLVRMK